MAEETLELSSIDVLQVLRICGPAGRSRWKLLDHYCSVFYTDAESVTQIAENARTQGKLLSIGFETDANKRAWIRSAAISVCAAAGHADEAIEDASREDRLF